MKLIVSIIIAIVATGIVLQLCDWALFIIFASKEEIQYRIGRP